MLLENEVILNEFLNLSFEEENNTDFIDENINKIDIMSIE